MTARKTLFLSSLLLLLTSLYNTSLQAQDYSNYYAIFITKFIDYVNWPSGKNDIVIGVAGNAKVEAELNKILKAKGKNYKVMEVSDASQASKCKIIFFADGQKKLFESIESATAGKSILLISEEEALAKSGAVISFYSEDNKLKFIVNKQAAESRSLQISSSLLNLAKVI